MKVGTNEGVINSCVCVCVCVCVCLCVCVRVLTYSLCVTSALTTLLLPRFEGGTFPALNHASSLVSWSMMGEGGAIELTWNEMDCARSVYKEDKERTAHRVNSCHSSGAIHNNN